MKLSALDIKQQKFEKSLRGYDPAEVDSYLNLIASEWENMVGKVRELETEVDKMNDKLKHYEKVEEALHETLQTAKTSAEQKLSGARKEAKNILDKAELEADTIVKDANQERQEIRQSILRLIDRRNEMINTLKSYLELAQNSLDTFSKDDSSLFTAPKRDISRQENDMSDSGNPKKSTKDSTSDEDSILFGDKNIDDIIDDID